MKQHQILFTDWGISKEKVERVLSKEFALKIYNFKDNLKSQFRTKDELTKKMFGYINKGQLIPVELIGEVIKRNLKSSNENLLITDFPRTKEQFQELKKISQKEHFEIGQIWYFKQADPKQFLQKYIESEDRLRKYEKEVIERLEKGYEENKKHISEMQSESISKNWKIIQVNFEPALNEEKIKRKIKACA